MDAIYSLALLIALVAGGLGAFIFVITMLSGRNWIRTYTKLSLITPICGVVALLAGFVSGLVHLSFGHGPESDEPMLPLQFLTHHKAYWLVLTLCFMLFAGWFLTSGHKINEDRNAA